MLNPTEQQKVRGFISDEVMSNAVKTVLREAFMKSQGNTDVQTLAAERIAIMLLDVGFKDLGKVANQSKKEEKPGNNVGL